MIEIPIWLFILLNVVVVWDLCEEIPKLIKAWKEKK
jgi:hypothetical protein